MHWQVLSGHAVLRMSQTDGQHTRTAAARRGALQVHIWVTCLTWEASTGCPEVPHNGLSGKHSWLRAVPAAQTRLLPCCQCPCPFPTATCEVARNSESACRSHLGPSGPARTGTSDYAACRRGSVAAVSQRISSRVVQTQSPSCMSLQEGQLRNARSHPPG